MALPTNNNSVSTHTSRSTPSSSERSITALSTRFFPLHPRVSLPLLLPRPLRRGRRWSWIWGRGLGSGALRLLLSSFFPSSFFSPCSFFPPSPLQAVFELVPCRADVLFLLFLGDDDDDDRVMAMAEKFPHVKFRGIDLGAFVFSPSLRRVVVSSVRLSGTMMHLLPSNPSFSHRHLSILLPSTRRGGAMLVQLVRPPASLIFYIFASVTTRVGLGVTYVRVIIR